jgi:dUTP pyrophosphatase
MKIGYLRLDPAANLPTRAHADDLGVDLYALEHTVLEPLRVTKVRTGIAVQFPEGVGGIIKDRSSVATKQEVFTVAGVIDPQYTGEIIVAFFNPTMVPVGFFHGAKIAQMVLTKAIVVEPTEIYDIHDTTRGDKGFGSSGV